MKYYLTETTQIFVRSLCIEDYGHPYFLWAVTEIGEAGDLLLKEHRWCSPFRNDFLLFMAEPQSYDVKKEWNIIFEFNELKQLPDYLTSNQTLNQNYKNALLQEISVII